MRILLANIGFALRLMRRSPGFYALVLVLLTGGIGATTAVFSVVESVLLKPLPYEEPEALTDLSRVEIGASITQVSAANFLDWRAQGTTFEQMAATEVARRSLSSEKMLPVSVAVAEATADFFPMLRVQPLVGRLLEADDDRPGAPLVAVISAQLWQKRFDSDPGVVGRTVMLNGRLFTIVGVGPRGFAFASTIAPRVEVWIPYFGNRSAAESAQEIRQGRGLDTLSVMGRRHHGVSLAAAQAQMTAVAKNLETAYYSENAKTGIYLRDLHDALVGARSRSTWVLFVAVGLVFIVVSANVASLILARAQGRRAELATRAALGATSSALVLQLVTETMVLFGIGSLLGSALASALVDRLASQLFEGTSIEGAAVHLDLAALLATVVTSLLFGLMAGLAPAVVTARLDPASVLKQSSTRAGVHKSQATMRALLVVTQLAVACALLTGSALAVKAFVRLSSTPPGFDRSDLASAVIELPLRKYHDKDAIRAFFGKMLARIGDLPSVSSVSATTALPMSHSSQALSFAIEGRPPWPPGEEPALGLNFIGPGYFGTMHIPVLRGRDFTTEDTPSSRRVVVLGQKAAERFFPGEDPIGRRLEWGSPPADGSPFTWREVVGIVGDVRKDGLAEPSSVQGYTPFVQTPESTTPDATRIFFVARTKAPEAVLAALPGLVQSLDAELAVADLQTMETRVAGTIGKSRQMAVVLAGFALAALVLATLGLFGLVSYTTTERTRELGIRLALGSPPEAVVGLVVRGAMKLVLLGLGFGFLLSVWVSREIAAIMEGALAFDLTIIAPIPVILGCAGLLASLLPALRAVRTPPASALRYD